MENYGWTVFFIVSYILTVFYGKKGGFEKGAISVSNRVNFSFVLPHMGDSVEMGKGRVGL